MFRSRSWGCSWSGTCISSWGCGWSCIWRAWIRRVIAMKVVVTLVAVSVVMVKEVKEPTIFMDFS
ncbi:hypothetical protein KSS87_001863, partial [Heliosperma pusillum]